MRHSLRLRALALVFLFNAAVFAALGAVLVRARTREREQSEERVAALVLEFVSTVQSRIRPGGLNVASILRWPSWGAFEDAILVDHRLAPSFGGGMLASGIDLNPVGVSGRSPGFDREGALRAIHSAQREGRPVPALGGQAVPIRAPDTAEVWGGVWYRTPAPSGNFAVVFLPMLPWFALSTLLLTAGTFLALRRLVLDPVAQLVEGSRRVRAGDFGVRLAVPTRRDELAELVRSFNDMTSTVESFNLRLSEEVRAATEKARAAEAAAMSERRLAAMGELAAGIAHEINNPLGGLQNAVEDLKRPELPPARRAQYLDLLARGLARIGETVNRLRRFTPREAPFDPVDLSAVAQDAIELVQHRARRLGVELVLSTAQVPTVAGVRNDIGQAVLNLLVNALDALQDGGSSDPRGPRIDIAFASSSESVRLIVQDNGPGVDPALLERVGDLFYTTKEVGRGTGLGLALVHSALQRHHGQVRISSERGRYFRVELHFPTAPAPEGA